MKINLITKEEYSTLLDIYKGFPKLIFQNQGYEYIDNTKLSTEELDAFNQIEQILKKSIKGFVHFNNFKVKNNKIVLRFQYDYGYDGGQHFIGVGYILLTELLVGFKSEITEKQKKYIVFIENETGIEFKGTTLEEASIYISENKNKVSPMAYQDTWAIENGY